MPVNLSQSSASTQFVQALIVGADGSAPDITSDTVQFAFVPEAYPMGSPNTWYGGTWAVYPGPQYWAQCLVGPGAGAVHLTVGNWQVWVKVTMSTEVPVFQDIYLEITP